MTAPLVPAEVNLRDFAYMPLDVVRLRDSEIVSHASGEGFRCAVLLWCVSWHQTPAGSLPNDEKALANYVGYGRSPKEWKKCRDEALHGWVLCDDGRLYHPVVAEKANEAWETRLRARWRKECDRLKKAAQRAQIAAVYPSFEEWLSHYKSTGQVQWRPESVPAPVPGDREGRPPDFPGDEGIKGREGKGREAKSKSFTPPPAPGQPPVTAFPPTAGELPPPTVDPEAWALWEAHQQAQPRWSIARRTLALGQLRQITADGHDATAVLTWATSRGLADLADAARRMTADAAKESNHATSPHPSTRSSLSLADQCAASDADEPPRAQHGVLDGTAARIPR